MKTPKLYNKLTGEQILKTLTLTAGALLLVAVNSAEALELSEGAQSLEVAKYNTCSANRQDANRMEQEFIRACSDAGLGGKTSCIAKLSECDSSDGDKCPGKALTSKKNELESLKDKLSAMQTEIQELNGSQEELVEQNISLGRAKAEKQELLGQALAEINTSRTQAQAQLNTDLQKLEIAVEGAGDQLLVLELGLREFVLSRASECETKAEAYRSTIYNRYVTAARNGNIKYSHASLFGLTGMSVKELVRKKANKEMSKCMSLTTTLDSKTKITAYGARYQLEKDKVKLQRNTLAKSIKRMQDQKRLVREAHKQTLLSLSRAETGQISKYQKEVLALNQQGESLQRKRDSVAFKTMALASEAQSLKEKITALEGKLQSDYGQEILAADEDDVEDFLEAQQAKESLLSALRLAEDGAERCGAQNWITALKEKLERGSVVANNSSDESEDVDEDVSENNVVRTETDLLLESDSASAESEMLTARQDRPRRTRNLDSERKKRFEDSIAPSVRAKTTR